MLRRDRIEENKEYLKSVIGVNRSNKIDWINSIGKEIEYKYDWNKEVSKGVLKIIKYDSKNRKVYFEGYEKGIRANHLIECKLGGMLGFQTLEFKYEIGATINCLTIIDREYRKDKKGKEWKYYKYECNKCGNEDWILESNLKKGIGCNVCCDPPQKVVLGINTIWDKARWMCDLGVSEEDAKKYAPKSNKKITVRCPYCGKIKKTTLYKIYERHSISCSCGDGISYPEKLMESVLIQLGIKYERQYKSDWSQNKIYDFYLPELNLIIETHGIQHYEENNRGRSLKEEQENDKLKEELALNNEVGRYIVVDCRKSELEYIRQNILNSELNELFDSSKIDWIKCGEYALKNKVKEVCDYYREHPGIFTGELAKVFGVSKRCVGIYLKKGTKIGWCEYDVKGEQKRNGRRVGKAKGKTVLQFTLEGVFIKSHPSVTEAEKQTGVSHISNCCRGERKTAGGFIWRYAE